MLPKLRCLVLAVGLLCHPPSCAAQLIQVEASRMNDSQGGYFAQWDPVQEKLLLHRDISASAVPAVRMYGKDGTELAIWPLRDLEGSWYMDVWGVAATPEGGVVIAAVVGYSPRGLRPARFKSALLTYDKDGKLKSFWEVQPYQYDLVAVDAFGDVFGFGGSNLKEPYPMVVKYSPAGKILKNFFSSSLLAQGASGILMGPVNGENEFFISGNELVVWVAASKELFGFSLDGDLLRRIQLSGALNDIARATANKHVKLIQISVVDGGGFQAQVLLWGGPQQSGFQTAMVRLAGDGSQAYILSTMSGRSKLLGRSRAGKDVYLEYEPASKTTSVYER